MNDPVRQHAISPGRIWTLCLLVTLSGCSGAVFLEGNRPFPKEPAFSIETRSYSQEELRTLGLRTDGVYVDIGFRPPEANPKTLYPTGSPYHRFWPNGRMLYRLPGVRELTAKDAKVVDSFEYAVVGHYGFTTNGTLVSEVYAYNGGKGRYVYMRREWTIEGDTIWNGPGPKRRPGSPLDGKNVELGYRFVKIDGMTAEPDW